MRQGSAANADNVIDLFGEVGTDIFYFTFILFLISVQARIPRMWNEVFMKTSLILQLQRKGHSAAQLFMVGMEI